MPNTTMCSIEGCEKRVQSRGWCPMHYQRWRTHGDPLIRSATLPEYESTCVIAGCTKERFAREWCSMHYLRWRRHGDPEYVRPKALCSEDDCEAKVYGQGLCRVHYQRRRKLKETRTCSVEGCEKKQFARSWCSTHYTRWHKLGDPLAEVSRTGVSMGLGEAFRFYMPGDPPADECWDWTGPITNTYMGYGTTTVFGKAWAAHRASYTLFRGEIPDGLLVRHDCDRPVCVNPHHLRLGTDQDNANDAKERGRRPHGEKHYSAKLTEDDVRTIRTRHHLGDVTYVELGAEYNVAANTIKAIVTRKTWTHVD